MNDMVRDDTERSGNIGVEQLDALVDGRSYVCIDDLCAGYGRMQVLFDMNLRVGRGQSLCMVGPNGAGKSTVLHALFGFNDIFSGRITIGEGSARHDVTALSPSEKLARAGIAYILQESSIFPELSVEENLWMGGFLKNRTAEARDSADRIFDKYPQLAARRKRPAGVLSGGERRILEILRALVMDPQVLLVDEPTIGLEPRAIDMVFELLRDLQRDEAKTIIMVEQNAAKGLAFADIGYVLVSGQVAVAGRGGELLEDSRVAKLFLGG